MHMGELILVGRTIANEAACIARMARPAEKLKQICNNVRVCYTH